MPDYPPSALAAAEKAIIEAATDFGHVSEPDLTAELDAAEAIMTGRAESIVTEWGVRYDDLSGKPAILGSGPDNERRARHEVACWPDVALIRRTVTYGPWEEVPGER